jgi:type VI protein secretion system component VasK
MSFWDLIWFLFLTYLFVAYLMVMFQIIGDLIRDRDLSGGVKAVWFIALLFLPVLTAVIYLIARGDKMADRQMQAARQAQGEAEDYIQTVASRSNPAQQITSAKALLDSGTITEVEFERVKAKALS